MKRARRAKRRLGGRGENGKGHTVIKYSPQGKVLLTLGQPGQAGNAPGMFDMPSDVITAANGDIFVADGHGVFEGHQTNDRIVKLSKDGTFITTWGKHARLPANSKFRTVWRWIRQVGSMSAIVPTAAFRFLIKAAISSRNANSLAGQAASASTRTIRSISPIHSPTTKPIRLQTGHSDWKRQGWQSARVHSPD
jgi:hypothetical protein